MAIYVHVVTDERGAIQRLSSTGHGHISDKGISVSCAAVSVLLRSFARSLSQKKEVVLSGNASQKGKLELEIQWEATLDQWYKGHSDLVLNGLKDVRDDFPDEVELVIERID